MESARYLAVQDPLRYDLLEKSKKAGKERRQAHPFRSAVMARASILLQRRDEMKYFVAKRTELREVRKAREPYYDI